MTRDVSVTQLQAPWRNIDKDLIKSGTLNLQMLKEYWIRPISKQGEKAECCNCGRYMRSYASGLCQTCYLTGKDRSGVDLLNSLTAKRAVLEETEKEDEPFRPVKVVGNVEITDPKYNGSANLERLNEQNSQVCRAEKLHESLAREFAVTIKKVNDSTPGHEISFHGRQDDPGQMSIYMFGVGAGPLKNRMLYVREPVFESIVEELQEKLLKLKPEETTDDAMNGPGVSSKRKREMFELEPEETTDEAHRVKNVPRQEVKLEEEVVLPVIKRSLVIEMGESALEFRMAKNTLDIRLEDQGHIAFEALKLNTSFIKELYSLINVTVQ